jgi:transcriptional regulator with XRE-family HTH domain
MKPKVVYKSENQGLNMASLFKLKKRVGTPENQSDSKISSIMSRLMAEHGLSESELAKQTGISQQVCNQISRGITANPRADTLVSLSKYFDISVGQLIGTEPLDKTRMDKKKNINESPYRSGLAPLLDWDAVLSWTKQGKLPRGGPKATSWVSCDLSEKAKPYAVLSNLSLEPFFKKNSVLIFDAAESYEAGDFVIYSLDGVTVSIRRLFEESGVKYLDSIKKGLPLVKLEPNHQILGKLLEVRMNFNLL